MKKLQRYRVGELPHIHAIIKRMRLREIMDEFIPQQTNEEIPVIDTIILLVYNLTIGKEPLYELGNWIRTLNLNSIGYKEHSGIQFTDDRFGRALDKLYAIDRSTLMTKIVLAAVKAFDVDLKQLHNDSTTVKAYGKYSGKTDTGFELKKGKSKDHRPDLKQLLYTLTISSDGAVPIHYKTYPGNRTDDTTHIETWTTLCKINNSTNFLYVADCKVCSDKQLSYITGNGGRVITIVPETWSEVGKFKEELRKGKEVKKEIWRRKRPNEEKKEYFFVYEGKHLTNKRGYIIHWIFSPEKQKNDRFFRETQLKKAERELQELELKINKRNLKTKEQILDACNTILVKRKSVKFINITINQVNEEHVVQIGRGRPGKNTEYKKVVNTIYTISWSRNKKTLEAEKHVDGVFPLLSTDTSIPAKEVLRAYKFQPRLEQRFTQFKSIHNAAPLLFKKLERIEANMFVFFLALMIQALIEREIRNKMKDQELPSLELYPENRDALHPTTSKVFGIFNSVSTYTITEDGDELEHYRDELSLVQQKILGLLGIDEETEYWHSTTVGR